MEINNHSILEIKEKKKKVEKKEGRLVLNL